jgi:CubicO group peptidase (beta-lactamase class C family)
MFYEQELDAVLQEIVARWGIPGLAVGIVQEDQIVYTREFGVQNLETQVPVAPDSVFCVASISKVFVATAVMQLAERGTMDLDAPIVQYLPYFRLDDDRYAQITIRQILSHTSGMPDMDEVEYNQLVRHPEADEGAAERYVRQLSSRKMAAGPGERFLYSNIAYNVLGDMIAKVSGLSFEAYVKEQVLLPAGMPHSTFLPSEVPPDRLAMPHLRTPEMGVSPFYPYHRADSPASNLHTTVPDMCHWGMTNLNRGSYQGQRLLSPATYEMMWTPVVDRGNPRPNFYEDMGLGWVLGHYGGTRTVSHGGGGFGWTDFFFLLPEKRGAAVILCNEESTARGRIIRAVVDTMLGEKPQAGTVSWMVPICQALAEGGLPAAYARYAGIKAGGAEEYSLDEYDLISLSYQLMGADKPDLALDVLGLNLQAFPESAESYLERAKIYLQQGALAPAQENLAQALALEPDNAAAVALSEQVKGLQ